MRRLPSDTAALPAEPVASGQLGISRSERPAAERAGALVDSIASSPCLTHVPGRFNIVDHGIPDRRWRCAVRSCLTPLSDSQCYPCTAGLQRSVFGSADGLTFYTSLGTPDDQRWDALRQHILWQQSCSMFMKCHTLLRRNCCRTSKMCCVTPLTVNAGAPALMAAVTGCQSLSRTRPGSRLHAVTGGIGTPRRRQARRRLQGAAAAAADEAAAMVVVAKQSPLTALPGLPCGGGGSPSLQRAPRPTPTFLASPQQTDLGRLGHAANTVQVDLYQLAALNFGICSRAVVAGQLHCLRS